MIPEINDAKIIQIKKHVQKYQPQIGLIQIIDFILDNWPNDQVSHEWLEAASAKTIGDWILDGIIE